MPCKIPNFIVSFWVLKPHGKEHRVLKQMGDETLTGSKYLWLYAEENLPEKLEERFSVLKQMKLKRAQA